MTCTSNKSKRILILKFLFTKKIFQERCLIEKPRIINYIHPKSDNLISLLKFNINDFRLKILNIKIFIRSNSKTISLSNNDS